LTYNKLFHFQKETTDYQVKLREKAAEQRQARREISRQMTQTDDIINGCNPQQTKIAKLQTVCVHWYKLNPYI
jgi:hypothetical protein